MKMIYGACVAEYQLPCSLQEQVRASVAAELCEVDDDDLLQAVMAIEQTASDNELSDDELLSAVVDAENSF